MGALRLFACAIRSTLSQLLAREKDGVYVPEGAINGIKSVDKLKASFTSSQSAPARRSPYLVSSPTSLPQQLLQVVTLTISLMRISGCFWLFSFASPILEDASHPLTNSPLPQLSGPLQVIPIGPRYYHLLFLLGLSCTSP